MVTARAIELGEPLVKLGERRRLLRTARLGEERLGQPRRRGGSDRALVGDHSQELAGTERHRGVRGACRGLGVAGALMLERGLRVELALGVAFRARRDLLAPERAFVVTAGGDA